MPAGRPSTLTEHHKQTIIDMLSVGDSVGKISKAISKAPSSIFKWIDEDEYLSDIYARAKESKAQVLAEEVIEISDNPDIDHNHKRIMVDARKWVAGKYYGKLFGDKQQIEHSGSVNLASMNDDELDRLIRERQQALDKAKQD
jgi:hypothetical protein